MIKIMNNINHLFIFLYFLQSELFKNEFYFAYLSTQTILQLMKKCLFKMMEIMNF